MAEMTKKALNKIKAAAFTEFKQGFSEEEICRQNVKRHSRQVVGLPGGMGH